MNTNYEKLFNSGLIKPFRASQSQIRSRIDLAKRDITVARKTMAHDRDWAFSIAYNAILQATRALMFAEGFRPATGEGQHKAAVQFAEITLGDKFQNEIHISSFAHNCRWYLKLALYQIVNQLKQLGDFLPWNFKRKYLY